MVEIERKFLVIHTTFLNNINGKRIAQGYLSSDPERTVRVRVKGDQGFLTIKGKSSDNGLSRYEWEKEITITEAQDLLKICLPGIIDKTRYEILIGAHIWEIDLFHGANDGLIIAEVELTSEGETVILPSWIDREVTGDKLYYNSYLCMSPFKDW
jgi:CYTH domain-containing protein